MKRHALAGPGLRSALVRLLLVLLVAALGAATMTTAQSVLGTIRGTVLDPQGAVVTGATVLVVDENSGVPRTVETDAEGRFAASTLRPGTYRIEVITDRFKKHEQAGVVLPAAGTTRVDITLELGAITESVTVSAEALNNITTDSQALAAGIDIQQLRDLPRSSRDMASFLYLNPNVLGGTDGPQFLGGRTYGVSYVQDGQASTNAIFGTIGNSAPGLDAIGEIQVLSNSYSAEYGGLAGVVVTTKRGGNLYSGTAFADFNSDNLNSLTFNQKLAGVERGDPNADTHQYRWGASLGGPIQSGKTFFFASYEGMNDKAIYGGARATVPTEAMRNGDFRGTAISPKDPLTGQPFPNQVIPSNRVSPAATNIMNFFWPLPNQGTISNGYGIFQEFVPKTRDRHRADLRVDHEASSKDSIFLRASYQNYKNNGITFEAGNALTNMPILDRDLETAAVIAGWTKVFSPTVVNEFRVGYNYDNSFRQSTFLANEVSAQLGLESAPSLTSDRRGFPRITFVQGSNRPSNITDQARNVDRTLTQNSFSLSNNTTFVLGAHSLKAGALWNRNLATDGFGLGVNYRGQYNFRTGNTGNAFTDFLLGMPYNAQDQVTTRGVLEGHSDDFAIFAQDDWRVNNDLTVFLGLRYEIIGSWHENSDLLANWTKPDGGHHVVPNDQVAALLPPGLIALDRTLTASEVGISNTLVNTDKNNFSPRVGFAWRIGGTGKDVLRGGFGLFHPTVAIQGTRDLLATNEFRYVNTYVGGRLGNAFSGGTPGYSLTDFGNQGIDPDLQSPDIYQYNLSYERELGDFGVRLSYIGSTMRGLLVAPMYNYLPASTNPIDLGNDADYELLPYYPYGTWLNVTENNGEGQLHALQVELRRRWKNGLAFNMAYTWANSDGTAPDTGNSSLGSYQYNLYDIEMDRAADPNVVDHRFIANATWDVPVGRGRKYGADMPGWADALFGGWTVSSIFQARTGMHLSPFFSGFYSSSPWNTGQSLDTTGVIGCCGWRADQIADPKAGAGTYEKWFDQTAYAAPGDGQYGNMEKGSMTGPGAWIINFAFYKDIVAKDKFRLQFSLLLDNAFNHAQFLPGLSSSFLDMTDYIESGVTDNGTTGVLGAGTIGNAEAFSPSRVIRLGIRATF